MENNTETESKNSCYTYFKIVGEFDTKSVTDMLGITPEKKWDIGDKRKNGSLYDFSLWSAGYCEEYNVEAEYQMRKTIEPFLDKKNVLKKIRDMYDVEFYLEIVPTAYVGETSPSLAPSMDIIDFCYETRTNIDIDLYLYGEDEE